MTGLVGAAILGALYAYIDLWIPLVYVTALACVAFGYAVGWLVSQALRWGRVRNKTFAIILALLVACFAMYVAWIFYVYGLFQSQSDFQPTLAELSNPTALWECIAAINEVGVWSIGSGKGPSVNGMPLWIVWAIELGIVVYFALKATADLMDDPYCETCDKWAKLSKDAAIVSHMPADQLKPKLEAGDLSVLESLGLPPDGSQRWLTLNFHQCPECGNLATLNVYDSQYAQDKNGNPTSNSKLTIKQLLISKDDAEYIRGLHARLQAAAVANAAEAQPADETTPPPAIPPTT